MLTQILTLLAWLPPEIMEADREARQLNHLVAAYSVVWALLALFIFILMRRNSKLLHQVTELEERLNQLEKR